MDQRADIEILEGLVPGVEKITLGGRDYPAREPSMIRAQKIMALQGEYFDLAEGDQSGSNRDRMIAVTQIMMDIVRAFSAEIEADWDRITEEATTEELFVAVEAVAQVVGAPFLKRALAARVPANRQARRKKQTR